MTILIYFLTIVFGIVSVSYTHLDVYTRQIQGSRGRLSEEFREICMAKHIRIVPCSYAEIPEKMCF